MNKLLKPDLPQRLYCPECFFSSRYEAEFVAHLEQEHKLRLEQVVHIPEGAKNAKRS